MDYIKSLIKAIKDLHGCDAVHRETVPVTEKFNGETAWEGEVEVFDLKGHPLADRAYAWAYETNGGQRFVSVLHIPPVDSARTAVQAAIVGETRNAGKTKH